MSSNHEAHWKETSRLTVITLLLWFFFSIVVHAFGSSLNSISFLGFPLGYYMAAQGSLLAFVIIIFGHLQDRKKLMRNMALMKRIKHDTGKICR